MVTDGKESALVNGGLSMEEVSVNGNGVASGESSTFDVTEGTQVDTEHMIGQKGQRKLKSGKNVPSVHIKKKKENKSGDAPKVVVVEASNGSVVPNAHTIKSIKGNSSSSSNGKEDHVTEVVVIPHNGKQDSTQAESSGEKVKPKVQKKLTHETSEDDTQSSNSPKADDGKPRKVGALPNYGFSFKCDQRAEKRKEFYVKLEEKTHAKEEEINNIQAKSKEAQEAELRKLRKSLNFKATPMPNFYQEPQPPKTELKKIPPTRPKSPKLGRKKTDSEETQTQRVARLSLDEKASKDNSTTMPTVDIKKQPVRKSLPRLPSQKTALPDGKPVPAKATTTTFSAKAKPERKKLEKEAEAETVNQNHSSLPIEKEEEPKVNVSSNGEADDLHEIVSPRMNEDRTESIEVCEAISVDH